MLLLMLCVVLKMIILRTYLIVSIQSVILKLLILSFSSLERKNHTTAVLGILARGSGGFWCRLR